MNLFFWTFSRWLNELNLFLSMTPKNSTFLFEYDSKNWTLFLQVDSKNWNVFLEYDSMNWTLFLWIWLNELNLCFSQHVSKNEFFSKKCSKNWTSSLSMTWLKELNFLSFSKSWVFSNMTLKELELFSKIRSKNLNLFEYDSKKFFENDSKNWTLHFNMTQREPFFLKKLKELNLFWMTQRIEPFCSKWRKYFFLKKKKLFSMTMTQRIELFFLNDSKKCDSKNWVELFFLIWLTELNLFFYMIQRMWTFFETQKIEIFFVDNSTQRFEVFQMTQRIELFLNLFSMWLKE